ncbi:TadE/TadG family type IV pilus assembly protein [Phycicoccus sp. Soil802]|uniref:TadE/TadG family type IV pilus assembly protein n=1 Tax=Phycicoccus sp. Soil802 TaxID=1736414 RepID=UPI001F17C582|nr:pilus assembly protein [Phycicoccus sp. Soil802]
MSTAMRRRLAARCGPPDSGSAVVEFVFLTVLLMVPLFYLVMTVSRVQAGSYAASTAAREAGRAYVTARAQDSAEERAHAAARVAFEDQGFGPADAQLAMVCDGDPCLRPEGRVEVTTTIVVPLPLVPSFARRVVPLDVPITASHLAVVDRFRGER